MGLAHAKERQNGDDNDNHTDDINDVIHAFSFPSVESKLNASEAIPIALPCFRRLVLLSPTDVEHSERHLQNYQRPRLAVPAPDRPRHVATEKRPEADPPLTLRCRGNQPSRNDGQHHGRPLQEIDYLHAAFPVFARAAACNWLVCGLLRGRLRAAFETDADMTDPFVVACDQDKSW